MTLKPLFLRSKAKCLIAEKIKTNFFLWCGINVASSITSDIKTMSSDLSQLLKLEIESVS